MEGSVDLPAETQDLQVRSSRPCPESVAVGAALANAATGVINPVSRVVTYLAQKMLQGPCRAFLCLRYGITGKWDDPWCVASMVATRRRRAGRTRPETSVPAERRGSPQSQDCECARKLYAPVCDNRPGQVRRPILRGELLNVRFIASSEPVPRGRRADRVGPEVEANLKDVGALIAQASRRGRRTGGAARVLRPDFAGRAGQGAYQRARRRRPPAGLPARRRGAQPGVADRWHGAAHEWRPGRCAMPPWSMTTAGGSPADKIHLFGFSKARSDTRSQTIEPGAGGVLRRALRAGRPFGLLRPPFPELFRAMGRVDLIVLPAAFTHYPPARPTGRCCFAPGRSRTNATSSRRPRAAVTQRTTHLRRHHADRPVGRDRGTPPRGPESSVATSTSNISRASGKAFRRWRIARWCETGGHRCIENTTHEHRRSLQVAETHLLKPFDLDIAAVDKGLRPDIHPPARLRRHVLPVPPHRGLEPREGIVVGQLHIDQGVGVRAISATKPLFAYSDDISLPALLTAAEATRAIGPAGGSEKVSVRAAQPSARLYHDDPLASLEDTAKVKLLERLEAMARAEDPASQVMAHIVGSWEVIMVARNDGHLAAADVPAGTRIGDGHHGRQGPARAGSGGGGGRFDYAYFTDALAGVCARGGTPGARESRRIARPSRHHDRGARLRLAGHPAARGDRPRSRGRFQSQG